jgi:hypothetical protein
VWIWATSSLGSPVFDCSPNSRCKGFLLGINEPEVNAEEDFFGSMSLALADAPVSGKVVKVDPNTHAFTVQWETTFKNRHNETKYISRERVFKTTDKTIYMVGNTKGSSGAVAWTRS